MMRNTKQNHSKTLQVRLTEEEHNKIHKKFSNSTCRKLSEYVRRVLLEKQITVNQRNQSLDDFMAEMIRLRNELNAIGNNLNQSVKKLYTLSQIDDFKNWIISNENRTKTLFEKVDEIKNKISQISDKWLQ